jgi:diguanylate cyclase (GGDEF)-like protein
MSEQMSGRTLLAARIVSNYGQSTIDCVVRRMSDRGATLTTESPLGIPKQFQLLIPGEGPPRSCKLVWQSGKEIGLEFEETEVSAETQSSPLMKSLDRGADSLMRGMMLALRSALDEIETGVVLLDADLRAQFINRAFRKMWALPDQVADSRPSFVTLMYHGRDTSAYEISPAELDRYVVERFRLVKSGDTAPIDLRRSNGTVIRMQLAVLPNGGRMLSYTYVTDIVRHSDELEMLRNALDNISDGVMLLDADLKAQFLNKKTREYWSVTPEKVAQHPTYLDLITNAPHAGAHGVPPEQLDVFFAKRVEAIRSADPPIRDALTPDGRHVRVHCSVTPSGGRMLTYCDVTDLVQNAQLLEKLATIDSMTGLYNRRHFMTLAEAEWSRFQRYQRPLAVLAIDIDHFKSVNDRYGHAVGDDTIVSVAVACQQSKRNSDIAGRLGGEEFFMLLPETDLAQATVVAERLREKVATHFLTVHKVRFNVTVSIGIAEATVSMAGFDVLLRAADQALYQAKGEGRNRIACWTAPQAPKLAAE